MTGCEALERMFIFFPSQYPSGNWQPAQLDFEDVWFESEDGVKLHGWYHEVPDSSHVILFAHGNAGNLSDRAGLFQTLTRRLGISTFMFDYRGYGRSLGRPSVQGVILDAKAARSWLSKQIERPYDEITLMGRSLGAAVVTQLAAHGGAKALILESSFSSFVDVGRQVYPFLPVRWLIKNDIVVDQLIQKYKGPLLQSHGNADRIIALELGKKVFEAANEPKTFLTLQGLDHNDPMPADYYQTLARFLDDI